MTKKKSKTPVARSKPQKDAPAVIFPPANETRRNEIKRAEEEAAARKKAGISKGVIKTFDAAPAGKRAAVLAAAQAGKLPPPPDFSAPTHERFRPRLAELVKLAKAKDVKGLEAFAINPVSTSPKAMDRYRNLAVIALKAQLIKAAA